VAGASVYGETTGNFNSGAATPASVDFGPYTATTDVEFAISLATTIPGDISEVFPNGLGSLIHLVVGDDNVGAGDVIGPMTYKLAAPAGVFKAITIDGDMSDWDGVPVAATDDTGDGGTGRDVTALYLANDLNNLYVRIHSANAIAYNGNEFTGIDGDNSAATGFGLFGQSFGSDTLVAGASAYGETTGNFNSGAATPASLSYGPYTDTTDVEFAVSLDSTIPGDISASFPGGIGSTIQVLYGDGNSGAGDLVGPLLYSYRIIPPRPARSSMTSSSPVRPPRPKAA
jgi:hypothetical protein